MRLSAVPVQRVRDVTAPGLAPSVLVAARLGVQSEYFTYDSRDAAEAFAQDRATRSPIPEAVEVYVLAAAYVPTLSLDRIVYAASDDSDISHALTKGAA